MQILDNFLIILIHVACFVAGVKLANWYHINERCAVRDALQRQYVRLMARADADDPVKPYGIRQYSPPVPVQENPITPEFMEHLRENGSACTKLQRSAK